MTTPPQFDIGIDIVEVKKFKKMPYGNNKSFYEKIFSPLEIKYCLKFKDPYIHFAGKFAIKEAVKKSIPNKVNLIDIVTNHSNSKPTVSINLGGYDFLVSLSHEKNLAVAVALSIKH